MANRMSLFEREDAMQEARAESLRLIVSAAASAFRIKALVWGISLLIWSVMTVATVWMVATDKLQWPFFIVSLVILTIHLATMPKSDYLLNYVNEEEGE